MSELRHVKRSELTFDAYGGPPGTAEIARLFGSRSPNPTTTMGAGNAVFEDCSIPWKLLYDEVICVLEGHFRLRAGDETYECEPGDVLWIPENTEIAYESDGRSVIFYTLYPENWREVHGIT